MTASRPRTWLAVLVLVGTAITVHAEPPAVQFNRDIRPILSDACYQCHGPDQAKRKAKLRLDTEAGAFADLGGHFALVAGRPEHSELFRRITAKDPAKRMPPARAGRQLTEVQIDVLRRWIAEGARWQPHWAFLPPVRSPLPQVRDTGGTRNPLDWFILARLEREGLQFSPEAERVALLRRVSFDLIGLPPTPAEVDAFLADRAPDAYERVVDRLLASPRYGERMARPWLDAARYADTSGYQSDGERFMWRWRDWVIEAFNRNLSYDQFTVEQLAGDLLPNPTLAQRIATGFNRNHRGNAEGGVIPEEYAVEYVVDRVDTTATVWLGLTMGCARCHDHKYDPVSQKEYYQMFAHFNNVPERGKAIKFGNSPPLIPAPTADQQRQLEKLERQLATAERRFAELGTELAAAEAHWEKSVVGTSAEGTVAAGLVYHESFDHEPRGANGPRLPTTRGRVGQAAAFRGDHFVELDRLDVGDFGFLDQFSVSVWVYLTGNEGGTILARMSDTTRGLEGYQLHVDKGKLHFNLAKRWLDDALRVETEESLQPDRWHHLVATYDGSRVASGIQLWLDGKPARLRVNLDDLNQTFQVKEPLRIGATAPGRGLFHGFLDEVRVFGKLLSPEEIGILGTALTVAEIAALPRTMRTEAQAAKLRAYFLKHHAPEQVRAAHAERDRLRRERGQLLASFPTTMVMEELPTPRDSFVLLRGEYDKRGEQVFPATPAVLPVFPPELPRNRLGLAQWLTQADHPLTARVLVNRLWQLHFGTGLVKTVDDFGAQGEWPTHPELLDWLAKEFVHAGWDMKALQRLIVTSATYRQSSRVTPDLLRRDPENRLLARGPRFRLPAEMIRDQALAASGLLVEQLGGRSVKPYQPEGLARDLGAEPYRQDHGPNLYRRSLYTFWKRTVAPPAMLTFDAAGRETCMVRETRTNTPLQALTLMNDVTYVEAARVLAERVLREGGPTPEARLTLIFQLVLGRPPRPAERAVLSQSLKAHLADFRADRAAAERFVQAGESPRESRYDPVEVAAYAAVAGLVLNLDEAITKE